MILNESALPPLVFVLLIVNFMNAPSHVVLSEATTPVNDSAVESVAVVVVIDEAIVSRPVNAVVPPSVVGALPR